MTFSHCCSKKETGLLSSMFTVTSMNEDLHSLAHTTTSCKLAKVNCMVTVVVGCLQKLCLFELKVPRCMMTNPALLLMQNPRHVASHTASYFNFVRTIL